MKRRLRVALLMLCLSSTLSAMEKVVVQLQWTHQFQFAGYYMAQARGYYRNAGLEVEIRPYRHGINVMAEVLSGRAQYGVGRSSLLLAYLQGQPVVAMAALFQSSPMVLLVREDSDIVSPRELIGKRVMLTDDQQSTAAIQAMLRAFHIREDQLQLMPHGFDPAVLERNETDAIVAYLSNEPQRLLERGVKTRALDPRQYGFDFYDDILFTTRDEIARFPERTRRFYDATLRGWRYAFDHVHETARLIAERYRPPLQTEASLTREGEILHRFAILPGRSLGELDVTRLDAIRQTYALLGLINGVSNLDAFVYRPERLMLDAKEQEWLRSHPKIRVGFVDRAPMEFVRGGQFMGVVLGYLEYLRNELGTTFEIRLFPTPEALESALQQRRVDMAMMLPRRQDSRDILYSDPYLSLPCAVIASGSLSLVGDLSQLNGERVAVVRGATMTRIADNHPQLQLVPATTMREALHHVASGDAACAVGPLAIASYLIATEGLHNLKIVGQVPYDVEVTAAVRRDWPALRSSLQKALDTMGETGRDEIFRTWVPTLFEHHVDYTLLWILLGAFVLIGIPAAYKYLLMDRLVRNRTKQLETANAALEEFNATLQQRIDTAVEENRTKERLMVHQAKMAAIGEMIESIAHQWRQPLNIIGIGISNLDLKHQLGTIAPGEIDRTITMVQQQIDYMSQTVDDFRNFFKSDKEVETVPLHAVIEEVASLVAPMLKSKKIALEVTVTGEGTVTTLPNELKQVLLNIINNARDAIVQHAAEKSLICLEAECDDTRARIAVTDSGGGIAPEVIDRIFEPYFTTKFESQGTGVGLYMAKTIVEKHLGGTLQVENAAKGACFTLLLPRSGAAPTP